MESKKTLKILMQKKIRLVVSRGGGRGEEIAVKCP